MPAAYNPYYDIIVHSKNISWLYTGKYIKNKEKEKFVHK